MAVEECTTNTSSGARVFARRRATSDHARVYDVGSRRRSGEAGGTASRSSALYVREGDRFYEADADQIWLRARELIDRHFRVGSLVLDSPHRTRLFLQIHLGIRDYEVFAVLFLGPQNRLIEYVELFRGTIDAASVHPREVAREALARNAAGVILVHNHPSGDAKPSKGDERITLRLKAALELVGVSVVDHLIVGESVVSFSELGLL